MDMLSSISILGVLLTLGWVAWLVINKAWNLLALHLTVSTMVVLLVGVGLVSAFGAPGGGGQTGGWLLLVAFVSTGALSVTTVLMIVLTLPALKRLQSAQDEKERKGALSDRREPDDEDEYLDDEDRDRDDEDRDWDDEDEYLDDEDEYLDDEDEFLDDEDEYLDDEDDKEEADEEEGDEEEGDKDEDEDAEGESSREDSTSSNRR